MTAKELFQIQVADAEYQLKKSLEGLTEEQVDLHPIETLSSVREYLIHLGEAYKATLALLAGEKYEWGSFQTASSAWAEQVEEIFALRQEAANGLLAVEDAGEAMKNGNMYIVAHDYYHVGQLCSLRFTLEPDWNPMSIYNF